MVLGHLPSLLLALPPVPLDFSDEVIDTICFRTRRVEPAGRSFHRVWEKPRLSRSERRRAHKENSDTPESSAESTSEEPSSRTGWSAKRKTKKPVGEQLKLNKVLDGFNLYEILKISPTATQEQIKKSYRHITVLTTSDSTRSKLLLTRGPNHMSIGTSWIALNFLQGLPSDLFGRALHKNPLRSLGHRLELLQPKSEVVFTTRIGFQYRFELERHVKRFYHFWMNFDSWRDFSQHDEYDVADASCREERRWVERQNQRIRRKYETAEASRIRKLVESAMQFDPRLLREKEDERRVKELQEKEKEEKRREKIEAEVAERRRKEAEEAELEKRKEEDKRKEKEERERLKKIRQSVRSTYRSNCDVVDQETLKNLLLDLTPPQLEKFAAKAETLASDGGKLKAMFDVALEHVAQAKKKSVKHVASAAAKVNKHGKVGAPWSLDEVHMLAKGQQKYKVGYAGRWKAIAQFLQSAGFNRTADEVIAQTRLMATPEYLKNQKAEEKQEATMASKDVPKPTLTTTSPSPQVEKPSSSPEDWTPTQQKALEKALATHAASLGANERWRRIADDVPGKTKKECVARFKYIRELVSKGEA
ncbi:conserved hypothetical protein [Perkinsus marinus ATCC 50983]|uniref:Myb-like domain-containing protein n=1 Tax=Perkinsus marinus (strain ATCC 50983 / TXsc) TaxID=423536 RepID=C5LAZ9_PERM5|nr:conserved hypothetical protein [Perkinsus marinus ATCC 50983]EER06093.1 conserved hypothetical protein [Perkinsus marinus ATCC 50983]|eukprot:XP_002774277.1 conserved hypothetical protein [Perkinsus marinus ATCC 50983]